MNQIDFGLFNMIMSLTKDAKKIAKILTPKTTPIDLPKQPTVKLISGGPLMTVESVSGSKVSCFWFDEKGNLKSATFDQSLLVEA